jgi:branched-chain amino acid aminotransferase
MLQTYDPRNADLLVWVNGRLLPRDAGHVSVFDSVVQGGDAVWEGLRVYAGRRVFLLSVHLRRLRDSAHALAFAGIPAEADIRAALAATLEANGLEDETHVRLTLTRGVKVTSGMDPRLNRAGCTLIVVAERKPPVYAQGLSLVTASVRRNGPAYLDSHIHHNNLLNNILAKIEANAAGADDALMLDGAGFVAETNATNVFAVRDGALHTPTADACLPGITRAVVLELAAGLGIPARERRLTLTECWTAGELFVTGTMGELASVATLDGRAIGDGRTPVLDRLREAFRERVARDAEPI